MLLIASAMRDSPNNPVVGPVATASPAGSGQRLLPPTSTPPQRHPGPCWTSERLTSRGHRVRPVPGPAFPAPRWRVSPVPAPPPCQPCVGFQDVGDTKLHLRDLQAFTCHSLQVKGMPWALRSEPPTPGRGRMVARLESSGRRWWSWWWTLASADPAQAHVGGGGKYL